MNHLQSTKTDHQVDQDLKSLLEQKPKPSLDDTVIVGLLAFLIQECSNNNQKEKNHVKTN